LHQCNAGEATAHNPGQQIVALPDEFSVGANDGLTVLAGGFAEADARVLRVLL
jgi:hypothetical protein